MKQALWTTLLCFALVAPFTLALAQPANGEAPPLPALPAPPYVKEHEAALSAHLDETRRSIATAESELAAASDALKAEDLAEDERTRLQAVVARLTATIENLRARTEALEKAITDSRNGPTQEQLAARLEYDRLVALGQRVLADLVAEPKFEEKQAEGSYARAIREAEEELARVSKLAAEAGDYDIQKSRVYERLSDLDKLDYELRWADQRLKLSIDTYDHIVNDVFPAYVRYEERAHEGLRAIRRARDELHAKFAGTPAEALDLGGLPQSGTELNRLLTEIDLRLNRRKGLDPASQRFRISALEGRLRLVQEEIDVREDFRDKLELEAERLRDIAAAEAAKPLSGDEAAATAADELSDYRKMGRRIEELERNVRDFRKQIEAMDLEREDLQRVVEEKRATERMVEQQVQQTADKLAQLEATFIAPEDATDEQRRAINREAALYTPHLLLFTIEQTLEAQNERLGAAKRDTRNAATQVELLDKRSQRLSERITEIETTVLPELRNEYYGAIGETVGWRAVKVVIVFALAWLLLWLIKVLGSPLIERIVRRADGKDEFSADEQQRARTLMTVFMTTARLVVYITAIMFAVAQFDVDYGPLLVAAGGVSLAVGFGAQSLVKDFFSGFFILLEGQFSIGDVVEINGKVGTVENLNLRTTVIRSLNGDVHTIPNGQINNTTNMTKLWSRTIVDIGVAYEENTDDVSGVLDAVAREMREDEAWGRKVIDHVVMGVLALGDSGVTIRVLLKTRAGEQWGASREYQRRVKLKFDELRIEIPWPQRVVSHKSYRDLEPAQREQQARRKRAEVLRYLRKSKGELIDEDAALAGMSVEERDRAATLAKRDAEIAREQAKDSGESADAIAATRKVEAAAENLSDAERLARKMAAEEVRQDDPAPQSPPEKKD